MLKFIFGEKVKYSAEYGTIIRRTQISSSRYIEVTEKLLLRDASVERVGGIIRNVPIYHTRSEQICVPENLVVDQLTGEKVVLPASYKTVTKRVIKYYRTKLILPKVRQEKQSPIHVDKQKFDLQDISVFLLRFFLSAEIREDVIGDVLEDYESQKLHLKRFADIWLVKEVVFTLLNSALDWFLNKIPINFNIRN